LKNPFYNFLVSTEILNARQAAFRRTNTDLGVSTNSGSTTNRMALALNKMRKQQQQQQKPLQNPPLPPQSFPQLARVLPQPRTTTTINNLSGAKHSFIFNASNR